MTDAEFHEIYQREVRDQMPLPAWYTEAAARSIRFSNSRVEQEHLAREADELQRWHETGPHGVNTRGLEKW